MDASHPRWIVGGRQFNVTTWALRSQFAFACLSAVLIVFGGGDADTFETMARLNFYLAGVNGAAIGGFTGKNMIEGLRKPEEE